MAGDIKLKEAETPVTLMDTNATLADGVRKAVDLDNGTILGYVGKFFLELAYTTSTPTAGTKVGELYILPGDNAASELFPEGGDGSVGNNVDPQKIFLAGAFESRNPSTSTVERLCVVAPLFAGTNRVVFKNTSGKTLVNTWQMTVSRELSQYT